MPLLRSMNFFTPYHYHTFYSRRVDILMRLKMKTSHSLRKQGSPHHGYSLPCPKTLPNCKQAAFDGVCIRDLLLPSFPGLTRVVIPHLAVLIHKLKLREGLSRPVSDSDGPAEHCYWFPSISFLPTYVNAATASASIPVFKHPTLGAK